MPSTKQLNGIVVDVATQQCHRPTSSQGASGEVRWCDARLRLKVEGGTADVLGDVSIREVDPPVIVIIGGKPNVRVVRAMVGTKPSPVDKDHSNCGFHRAAVGMRAESVSDNIAFALVLLGSKVKA